MTVRRTLHDLNFDLMMASNSIPDGSLWLHTKSGKVYEAVCVSAREYDGGVEVVYRPAPDNDLHYETVTGAYSVSTGAPRYSFLKHSRPFEEWFEMVDASDPNNPDTIRRPRFVRVELTTTYTEV